MTLIGRGSLQEKINEQIDKVGECEEDKCHCYEKLKDKLKYSILSHRWSSHELTFGDLQKFDTLLVEMGQSHLTGAARVEKMQAIYKGTPYENSLTKLVEFLRASEKKHCEYAWADTLCINKESSAELDESIRSMYAWYRDSHICIVHLSETTDSSSLTGDPWFTRGWTLQELLAPKRITFFSKDWKQITRQDGNKLQQKKSIDAKSKGNGEAALWPTIAQVTGIPIEDLLDFKPGLYDIGKRMSWASRRRTTRIEDMAYCLIGIFSVNLSVSYGEKEGAFYRLQAEIFQNTEDRSLFNWAGQASAFNSMFANSPECFYGYPTPTTWSYFFGPPPDPDYAFISANFALRIPLALHDMSKLQVKDSTELRTATAFAILDPSEEGKHFVVALEQIKGSCQYKRVKVWSTTVDAKLLETKPEEIIIK